MLGERKRSKWHLVWLMGILMIAVAVMLVQPQIQTQAEPAGEMDSGVADTAQQVAESEQGLKVLVLNYHKIDDVHHSLSVAPDDFDRQMKYLYDHGYHSISPDELYGAISGQGGLPENPVLITFDDGYRDNYTNAYPILRKYNFKATIFVVTSFLSKMSHYLTWDQAREMEQHGISIQSHTVDHKSMTDLTDDQLRAELIDSKKKAEEELGHEVGYMAYPTGTYNLHIAEMVKEAGYKAAFTIKYGNVDEASNIYAIERVPIFHTEHTYKDFLERIHYLPLFSQFGWEKN